MFTSFFKIIIFLSSFGPSFAVLGNLLVNGNFENPNSIRPWECISCHARGVQDSLVDYWSVMVSERGQSFSALRQTVNVLNVTSDKNYVFKCFIKFLDNPRDKMYAHVHVYVSYTERNGNNVKHRFVDMPRHRVAYDWTEVSGDFYIPADLQGTFSVSIEIPDHDVDYLIDDASLVVIPENVNWKTAADAEIDRIRKATLTLVPVGHHNSNYDCGRYSFYCIDISNMYVEIKQTRSQYAFGSSVLPEYLVGDEEDYNYKQFVNKNFEWALVHELMNWGDMEPIHGTFSNNTRDLKDFLDYMARTHKKTWGSGLFSALTEENPNWLSQISVRDVKAAIQERINMTAQEIGGRFDNLDVYRDMLQDDLFERITQSPNISMNLFKQARQAFRTERLLLDEQSVLNSSLHTTAYRNLAKRFKVSGVPVDGMGIIAMFNSSKVDMYALKYRLDKLAEVGYPLWISSLSIHNKDVSVRAKILDDVMTLLYSRPEIKGICLDDVWDGEPLSFDSSLADGRNFNMNAAGRVYENRWHTHGTYRFNSRISLRVYKGTYDIIVKNGYNGSPIYTHHITVGDSGESVTIHVTGQGQNYRVSNVVG